MNTTRTDASRGDLNSWGVDRDGLVSEGGRQWRGWPRAGWSSRPRRAIFIAVSVLALVALVLWLPLADGDTLQDVGQSLYAVPRDLRRLWWPPVVLIVASAAVHYVLAAIALRAVAGRHCRIAVGEGVTVSLVATVANRLSPSGLGGAAVNARFLVRRGMPLAEASGAVAGLALFGAVADLAALLLILLTGIGRSPGGTGGRLTVLTGRLSTHAGVLLRIPLPVLAMGAAVALTISARIGRRRKRKGVTSGRLASFPSAVRRAFRQAGTLLRRPADLAVLLLASAGTTVVLGIAMVFSVAAVHRGFGGLSPGDIVVAFMIGSAVGTSVPIPAGIGSTEAALAAALVPAGVSLTTAVGAVLLFRLITFWGPVPAGIFAGRALRRRGAL